MTFLTFLMFWTFSDILGRFWVFSSIVYQCNKTARRCRLPNVHIFKTKISKLAGFDWCEIGNKNAIFLLFFVFLEEDH